MEVFLFIKTIVFPEIKSLTNVLKYVTIQFGKVSEVFGYMPEGFVFSRKKYIGEGKL